MTTTLAALYSERCRASARVSLHQRQLCVELRIDSFSISAPDKIAVLEEFS